VRGKYLVADPTSPKGFSFTGDPIPFDPGGVFPINANQRLADLDPNSEAGQQAQDFARVLTRMLTALQNTFGGNPTASGQAIGLMYRLESIGKELCAIEVVAGGKPTGRNAGPTWEFLLTSG